MLRQLLVTFICAAFCMSAYAQQVLVRVNSPADLEGSYTFTNAFDNAWGADLTTGTWTGDLVMVEAMTAPTNEGCDSLVNGADISGNIALVDRGSCNFSLKALLAQNAGAIACVILNHSPGGPVGMGAGDFATDVTIPVVMLGLEDGQLIKDEMANGPVNMTIGSFNFPNDIGATNAGIIRNPNGVMPVAQANAAAAEFLPGAQITNNGENDAANIVLSTSISHADFGGGSSSQVHTDAITIDLLEADSSGIFAMDNSYVADAGAGIYSVDYSIVSDSTDNFDFDNNHSFDYVLSENAYTKGQWDLANDRPFQNAAFTIGGGSSIEFLSGFQMPLGIGYSLDVMQVYMTSGATGPALQDIGASNFTAYVYRWDDANEDLAITNDELTTVAIGLINDFADPTATEAWVDFELQDFDALDGSKYEPTTDDNVFIIGMRYQGATQVFFGFDTNYDQFIYYDFIAPSLADLSYFFVDTWTAENLPDMEGGATVFTDFYGSLAQSLRISQVGSNATGENNPEIGSFEVFPNPVSNQLNVETKLTKNYDQVDYTIVNSNGAVVSIIQRAVNGSTDNATLDVSGLAAGQYFLNVNTVDGSVSKAFNVQR